MEWVEITARTVDEAKEQALDRLGVAPEDAEFEVVAEPKPGLFGRLRGEARVRARVRPAPVRQKVDRRDRRGRGRAEKNGDAGETSAGDGARGGDSRSQGQGRAQAGGRQKAQGSGRQRQSNSAEGRTEGRSGSRTQPAAESVKPAQPSHDSNEEAPSVSAQQVGEEARTFIDQLVAAFGMTGTTELIEDGDDLEIRVHGENLGLLVGPRGTTLQAVQDLARVASQRRLGDHDTRLRVDIGGYRQRRKEALDRFAMQMADEVKGSGIARVLEPMSSADRKIVHDALSGVAGITTRSEGDDPYRRVVISPADA